MKERRLLTMKARHLVASAALIAIMAIALAQPASGQPTQWVGLNSTVNTLFSVFMLNPNYGWAVGGAVVAPAAELWNGVIWKDVAVPAGIGTLRGVHGVVSNDVWAVGDAATIIRWDGFGWSIRPAPAVTNLLTVQILPGGADGWAGGTAPAVTPNLIRLSGTGAGATWTAFARLGPAGFAIRSIHMLNPTYGWAVGDDGVTARAFQFDGAGWIEKPVPAGIAGLNGVFTVSTTDAWAVGGGAASVIIRWNGASWTGPLAAPTLGVVYRGVYMVSANDGWIVGDVDPVRFEGTLLRWNGAAWNIVRSFVVMNLLSVFMLPGGADGWATGFFAGMIRWDNTQWNSIFSPAGGFNLFSVHVLNSGEGWAVGALGNIFRWNGLYWRHYETLPSTLQLNDVFERTMNDAWIVGNSPGGGFPPTILRWNGAAWTQITPAGVALGVHLQAVYALSANEAWAVGTGDTVLKWDGSLWTSIPSGRTGASTLFDVFMLSSTDGWAVGDSQALVPGPGVSSIIHWNGFAWTPFTTPAGVATLRSVFFVSSANGWAVGDGGVILHWDGVQWLSVGSPVATTFRGVSFANANDGWIVGDAAAGSYTFVHWDGLTWTWPVFPVPPNLPPLSVRSVSIVSPTDAWAVTVLGLFFHLKPQVTTTTVVTTTSVTVTSSSATTSPTTPSATSTTATTAPTAVPGFPWESIAAGIITGLATLTLLRVRKRRRA